MNDSSSEEPLPVPSPNDLERLLGYHFKDPSLLARALEKKA